MSAIHRAAGRVGGLTRFAKETDRTAATAPARLAFLRKFDNEPDPERARRLYFAQLRLKRVQADAKRKRRAA